MRNRKIVSLLFLPLIALVLPSSSRAAISWKHLAPGLEEASYSTHDSQGSEVILQLYKIQLHQYRLKLVQAAEFMTDRIYAKDLVKRTGALLAMNASFFDPAFKPLGLIVNDGKTLNPLRPISWWAVFSLGKHGGPKIEKIRKFDANADVEMAVQAGPRLVEDGKPVPTKPNYSQKSFVAIMPTNEVILGATERGLLDSNELSRILADEIHVKQALNLDGGGSTQLYAKVSAYEKEILGFTPVANGIVVVPRK